MHVIRDLFETLRAAPLQEAVLLWGPRQVGKTTLLSRLSLESMLFLDDLSSRQRAQVDPALVLDDMKLPCLIDEVQYAPNLFSEIKLRIDRQRRENLNVTKKPVPQYFLTGSNRLLLDQNIKESLAGRCSLLSLHGFSVREILANFRDTEAKTILFKGGFPQLYTQPSISSQHYLNDYILSFIEKDIAVSAGIEKIGEFHTVLQLLAARTGQFLNVSEVAGAAGVKQQTVQAWIEILQRNAILELVAPFHSNLSKRITKMQKLHFYDVGLCARLQGHNDEGVLWHSAQVGGLFESLVFAEIIKTRENFLKHWRLFTWRTKEKHEIDFILQNGNDCLFIEAKLAIHGASPFALDGEARRVFPSPHKKIVVTAGGTKTRLDRETFSVPIQQLGNFLLETFL